MLVTNATFAAAYAFKQGNSYGGVVLNKKVDCVHNGQNFGNGTVPLALRLSFTTPRKITLYKLSSDPRLTNRQQMNIPIATLDIPVAYFAKNFIIDQYTGGRNGGLPVGAVFLYVFDNVTEDTLQSGPQVTINQAMTQADPHGGSVNPINYFTVVFDQPVTGFTSSAVSIVLDGSAEAQTTVITPRPGSANIIYTVAVSGTKRGGIVRAEVLAGTAVSADGGTPCAAPTSTDNVVTNLYPSGMVLTE
ncbi:MAG: hypothetical protein N2595_09505 [bacterium]|nr:hypothetical protein [bacterium]